MKDFLVSRLCGIALHTTGYSTDLCRLEYDTTTKCEHLVSHALHIFRLAPSIWAFVTFCFFESSSSFVIIYLICLVSFCTFVKTRELTWKIEHTVKRTTKLLYVIRDEKQRKRKKRWTVSVTKIEYTLCNHTPIAYSVSFSFSINSNYQDLAQAKTSRRESSSIYPNISSSVAIFTDANQFWLNFHPLSLTYFHFGLFSLMLFEILDNPLEHLSFYWLKLSQKYDIRDLMCGCILLFYRAFIFR